MKTEEEHIKLRQSQFNNELKENDFFTRDYAGSIPDLYEAARILHKHFRALDYRHLDAARKMDVVEFANHFGRCNEYKALGLKK
tara:strand:- start:1024 stop:1275 length:252 start_codon:yes stop_codon:yes gene_type:complete